MKSFEGEIYKLFFVKQYKLIIKINILVIHFHLFFKSSIFYFLSIQIMFDLLNVKTIFKILVEKNIFKLFFFQILYL